MTGMVLLVIGLAGQWLLGTAVAHLLLGSRTRRAEWLGLGLVLGIGVTAWLQFLWSLAGGRLGRPLSLGLTALGFVAGLWVCWRRRRERRSADHANAGSPDAARANASGRTLLRFGQAIIVVLFAAALAQALLTPQRFWDERAMFAIKARVLFEDRSIHSPDLLHPDFVQGHPRYPLLLPLAEQHVYALLGRPDDRWGKVVPPLLYLGLVLTFAGVASRHIRSDQAWLFAVLLATTPVLMPWEYGVLSAQADAPVACFHGISVLYLWDWLRHARTGGSLGPVSVRPLGVAGLAAGMALFTKDEGIALLLVDLVAFALAGAIHLFSSRDCFAGRARTLRSAGAALGLFIIGALLIAVPWFWHRRHLPTTTEIAYFGRLSPESLREGFETLAWSIPHLLRRMFLEARQWGLTWWLMLLAGLTRPLRSLHPAQALLILDVLGALAALLIAGMIAPTPVEEHVGGSSHRFLMQLVPSALLFAAGQWGIGRGAGELQ